MGWLAKEAKGDVVEVVVPDLSAQDEETVHQAWVKNLSDEDAHALFDKLRGFLTRVNTREARLSINDNSGADHALWRLFMELRDQWFTIDRSNLSYEDAALLYRVVGVVLPDLLTTYRANGAKYGHAKVLKSKQHGFQGSGISWMKLLKSLYEDLVSLREKQARADFQGSFPEVVFVVPSVKTRDTQLAQMVRALHEAWVGVSGKSLSVEDRFFVDQVAGQYFPDAWSMLQSFTGGDAALARQARVLFLEQVGLMTRRLQTISSHSQEASLQELAAHSQFLREVTSSPVGVS